MKKFVVFCLAGLLMLLSGLVSAAVDLNTATVADLEKVKGLGPVKSKAIIEYRDKNGPFKSVDDLKGVKGIGVKTIEKLRPELSVGGEAPAAPVAPPVVAPKSVAPVPPVAPTPPKAPPAPVAPAPAAPAAPK